MKRLKAADKTLGFGTTTFVLVSGAHILKELTFCDL
jgi:hypothetical protein